MKTASTQNSKVNFAKVTRARKTHHSTMLLRGDCPKGRTGHKSTLGDRIPESARALGPLAPEPL